MKRTVIGIAVIAVLAGIILIFGPRLVSGLFTAKQEARVAKGQAGASIKSGAEAMNTIDAVQSNMAASEATAKEGSDEIWNATAGDSNDAADRATCRMRYYRDSERCAAMRTSDSRLPAGADNAR